MTTWRTADYRIFSTPKRKVVSSSLAGGAKSPGSDWIPAVLHDFYRKYTKPVCSRLRRSAIISTDQRKEGDVELILFHRINGADIDDLIFGEETYHISQK